MKRRLAISHRKVGKLFDHFLSSFGGESELLERDFTNRLKEIEEEMQEEREQQEQQENQNSQIHGKWDWGKVSLTCQSPVFVKNPLTNLSE